MEIGREAVEVEKDEPLKCELAAFVDCAAKGEQPRVSGQQGAAALDRKSTRLNSSHMSESRMPSSA